MYCRIPEKRNGLGGFLLSKRSVLDSLLIDKKKFLPDDDEDSRIIGEKLRRMALKALQEVVREELSPAQKKYLVEYYYEEKSMKEISEKYGVNISTVSRTISRGRKRIMERIKYYFVR